MAIKKFCPECKRAVILPHTHLEGETQQWEEVPLQQQTLYAFWDYGTCPYVLGAEIIKFRGDGKVKVKGYDGCAFQPIKILADETGKEALRRIKELRGDYSEEERTLKEKYKFLTRKAIGLEDK